MKNYIKNHPFLSFVLMVMWIFFLGISIAEKGFFIKNITEPIGTTITFIVMGNFITINKDKIQRAKERKEINQERIGNVDGDGENNIKKNDSNKGRKMLKKLIIVFLGMSIIITSTVFYLRKLEFSFHDFFIAIIGCCFLELAIAAPFAFIINIASGYAKKRKEQGFFEATMWLITFLVVFGLIIYNAMH